MPIQMPHETKTLSFLMNKKNNLSTVDWIYMKAKINLPNAVRLNNVYNAITASSFGLCKLLQLQCYCIDCYFLLK